MRTIKRIINLPRVGRPEVLRPVGYSVITGDFLFLYAAADGHPAVALVVGAVGAIIGGSLLAGANQTEERRLRREARRQLFNRVHGRKARRMT